MLNTMKYYAQMYKIKDYIELNMIGSIDLKYNYFVCYCIFQFR